MEKGIPSKIWRDIKFVFKYFSDKIKDHPISFGFIMFIILIVIGIVIGGGIFSLCWNATIPHMFGLSRISIISAFILLFSVKCLRFISVSGIKQSYNKVKEQFIDKEKLEEHQAKVLAGVEIFLIVVLDLILIGLFIKYSWNRLIPKLFNVDLVKISFWQAIAFSYLCSFILGGSYSDTKKTKRTKNNKEKDESVEPEESTINKSEPQEAESENVENKDSESEDAIE